MTIAEMRARAIELLAQARSIQAAADEAKIDLTEEQEAQVFVLLEEREGLLAKVARKEKLDAALLAAEADELTISPRRSIPDDPVENPLKAVTVAAEAVDNDQRMRHGFSSLGEFAMATHSANPQAMQQAGRPAVFDNRLQFFADTATTGMSQAVGADGGFLVPPEFSQSIWDEMNEGSANLLNLVDLHTIAGESMTFNANAETDRATGSRYGGIQGYWMKEAEQFTASKPTLRQLTIEPEELGVFVRVTNKLLGSQAGATLTSYLRRAASDEINFLVGDAIVNGNGVGKPLGLLNCGCLVSVAEAGGQVADTLWQANINSMWARLHKRSRASAVWLMNQDCQSQLDQMTFPVTNVAGTENVGGIAQVVYNSEKHTLKGRPVIDVEYCQTLGDVGDIILFDPKSYAAGVRSTGVESAISMHLYFDYNESAFRFIFAVDGQSWLASAITPFNGANTLSTIVAVATRVT